MIGKFRAWMKRKIKELDVFMDSSYEDGYQQAMEDVAEYFDFPLGDKAWEKWQP